jgi:hypothetical protein
MDKRDLGRTPGKFKDDLLYNGRNNSFLPRKAVVKIYWFPRKNIINVLYYTNITLSLIYFLIKYM